MNDSKGPDWSSIWLDPDVAQWLHEQAERLFGGDTGLALNEFIRVLMAMERQPDDMWAAPQAKLRAFDPQRQVFLRRHGSGRDPRSR